MLIAYLLAALASLFAYGKLKEKQGADDVKNEQAKESLDSMRKAKEMQIKVARMPRDDVIKRLLERKTK